MVTLTVGIIILIYCLIHKIIGFSVWVGIAFGFYIGYMIVAGFQIANAALLKRQYKNLYVGMSRKKLFELLGEPDSTGVKADGTIILHWISEEGFMKGALFGVRMRTITVEIKEDAVIAFDNFGVNE